MLKVSRKFFVLLFCLVSVFVVCLSGAVDYWDGSEYQLYTVDNFNCSYPHGLGLAYQIEQSPLPNGTYNFVGFDPVVGDLNGGLDYLAYSIVYMTVVPHLQFKEFLLCLR